MAAGPRVRRVGLWVSVLGVVLLAGCGALSSVLELSARLNQDGYGNANVEVNSTNGYDTVDVTTDAHPTRRGDSAYEGVARAVWTTLPLRFDVLRMRVGASALDVDRSALTARYGPRDPALDARSVGSELVGGALKIAIGVGVALVVAIVLGVVLWLVLRRRRRAAG